MVCNVALCFCWIMSSMLLYALLCLAMLCHVSVRYGMVWKRRDEMRHDVEREYLPVGGQGPLVARSTCSTLTCAKAPGRYHRYQPSYADATGARPRNRMAFLRFFFFFFFFTAAPPISALIHHNLCPTRTSSAPAVRTASLCPSYPPFCIRSDRPAELSPPLPGNAFHLLRQRH